MITNMESQLAELRTEVKGLKEDLREVKDSLSALSERFVDNGRPGLLTRLDRLERSEAIRSKLLWLVTASVVGLAVRSLF